MALWVNIKRVSRYGVAGFVRNGFVSLAAVLVMTLMMFVLANVILSNAAMKATLTELSNEVDVTVYFTPDASDASVQSAQTAIKALPEVASVSYLSADQALSDFKQRHASDQLTLQALDELGSNPFGAALDIRAKETSQYQGIADYLTTQQENGTDIGKAIDKVNYNQNKTAIDRLTTIISSSERNALAKMLLLAICSILIVFNTIRLAIYTSRDEIGVMNLVGAGRWYVRGPFVIAGILYGAISGIIVLLLLYPILLFYPVLVGLDPTSELLFSSFNSFSYYTDHFVFFFFALMLTGVVLGALSSYLAIRRYLRV